MSAVSAWGQKECDTFNVQMYGNVSNMTPAGGRFDSERLAAEG